MARSCVFCGGQPVTLEDVFPRWLGGYLGRRLTYTVTGAAVGEGRAAFRGLSMTAKAKRVCANCNNGWMSRMETEASALIKPLLGEAIAVRLTGGESGSLTLLARWAMKTALMIQYVHQQPAIPEAVYQHFYHTQLPPPGGQCVMFLARHTMNGMPNGAHSLQWSVKGPPAPGGGVAYEGQMYGTTFCIANLVVQVVGYVPTLLPVGGGAFEVEYPVRYLGHVERLWPGSAGITWPLRRPVLDDIGLIGFSRALAELQASRVGLVSSPYEITDPRPGTA